MSNSVNFVSFFSHFGLHFGFLTHVASSRQPQGVPRIFHWGGGARPQGRRPRAGMRFLGSNPVPHGTSYRGLSEEWGALSGRIKEKPVGGRRGEAP